MVVPKKHKVVVRYICMTTPLNRTPEASDTYEKTAEQEQGRPRSLREALATPLALAGCRFKHIGNKMICTSL